jgi:hypothetical protein
MRNCLLKTFFCLLRCGTWSCSYKYGLVQRGAGSTQGSENHPVRKPTCTGRRGHELTHHLYVPSQKRTHVRSKEERPDQLVPTEHCISHQPTPDQPTYQLLLLLSLSSLSLILLLFNVDIFIVIVVIISIVVVVVVDQDACMPSVCCA